MAGSEAFTKATVDPADMSWIKRWAAIGDSYTAGIGAGLHLGRAYHGLDDWICSRYDQSYPMVVNNDLGSSVTNFQYLACSGARTDGIYKQVTEKLTGDLNMVMMTAGGNDLCLASMINKCVILPYGSMDMCNAVIAKAIENIGTILKPNIKMVLLALNDKMADNSVVVVNGYAQFWNTENEEYCTKKQAWAKPALLTRHWLASPNPLDVALRKRLNSLVIGINNAIKEVIRDVQQNSNVKYKLGFADWGRRVNGGVREQYCGPNSSDTYLDKSQPDQQFFKSDTTIWNVNLTESDTSLDFAPFLDIIHDEFKKRELNPTSGTEWDELVEYGKSHDAAMEEEFRGSILYNSANPRADALHMLNPRDTPSPLNCPGDSDPAWNDPTLCLGLSDTFGKIFHPNELGHITMARFALDRVMKLRAEALSQDFSRKKLQDFTCWQKQGSKGYAHPNVLDENYKDFCNTLKAPENQVGWKVSRKYNEGTPDENDFSVELSTKAGKFNKDTCLAAFNKIIHSCDGSDSENPMNWKFGGIFIQSEYTWRVDIKRNNRQWPPYRQPIGWCDGTYKFFASSYEIKGGGWATADWGQKTLKSSTKRCIGSTPSSWKFWYYDQPDKDGYEWSASFNTPIWVRKRCFKNNKVQNGAGGHTNGCSGSD
ncbi:Alpha-galactosyl-binding fungal lectin [Microdochium nivale]|nr:Alpha-galactosyl-binding fungal lectin [Microdochium nivale]